MTHHTIPSATSRNFERRLYDTKNSLCKAGAFFNCSGELPRDTENSPRKTGHSFRLLGGLSRSGKLRLILLPLLASALLLGAGCGSDTKDAGSSHAGHNHSPASSSAPANAFVVPESGKVSINADDNMRYSLRNFVVRPGQQIELTLNHTGTMPLAAMGHNIAILKKGTNLHAFVQAAVRSAKTEYIPESMSDSVLAHTKMLGGGQSDTIIFTAPDEPGEYDFLCSFPAHLTAGMKGKMIVANK